jgi:hypothetical protein
MSNGGIPLWRLILECAVVGIVAALVAVWIGHQFDLDTGTGVAGGVAGGAAGGAAAAFGANRLRAAKKRAEGDGDG